MIVLSVMVRSTYTGNIIQSAESSYGHHFAYYHAGTLVFMPPKSQLTKMYRDGALGCNTINSYGVFPFDVSTSRFWEDLGLPGAFAATAGPPSPTTAATTSGRRCAGAHTGIGVADCNGGDGPVSRGRDEGGLHLRGRAIPIQSGR